MLQQVAQAVSVLAGYSLAAFCYLVIALMVLGFALGVPLAIIDIILPGSPLGLQDWARENRG